MASKHAVLGLTKTAAVDLESLLFAMKVEGGQLNVSRIGRSFRRIRMVCFMAAIRFNGYHRGHEGDTEVTLSKFPWDERYRVSDIDNVLTPALVVYPEIIESYMRGPCICSAATQIAGVLTSRRQSWPTLSACWWSVASAISSAQPRSNC